MSEKWTPWEEPWEENGLEWFVLICGIIIVVLSVTQINMGGGQFKIFSVERKRMKIECLKPGTDITIDASDGTKNLSFASSVLEVTENDREYLKQVCPRSFNLSQIPIAVVYEQEYVVNFESKTAVCSVTALIDGRPYIWDRVKIIIINLPDSGNCYMAFSTGNVKPYNRRSEYRLPLMGYSYS